MQVGHAFVDTVTRLCTEKKANGLDKASRIIFSKTARTALVRLPAARSIAPPCFRGKFARFCREEERGGRPRGSKLVADESLDFLLQDHTVETCKWPLKATRPLRNKKCPIEVFAVSSDTAAWGCHGRNFNQTNVMLAARGTSNPTQYSSSGRSATRCCAASRQTT